MQPEHSIGQGQDAQPGSVSRRRFLLGTGAAAGALLLPLGAGANIAHAEPRDEQWLANFEATRLVDADGSPLAYVPQFTRLRLMQALGGGMLQVWVPRLGLVGRVAASVVGPVGAPSQADLDAERAAGATPTLIDNIGLPARVVGGANVRLWPVVSSDSLLKTLPHNAPLRAISSVEGDDGDVWYHVNWQDPATFDPVGDGYIHNSLVRLPRLPYLSPTPDRQDTPGRHFEADLQLPAMLVAFEDGAPIWSTLTLKGTPPMVTPVGYHQILRRVANETMTSERVYPPIPRNAPGGYYLTNVLFTQYFTYDGASIHYNYWSSNWGYPGSHGCMGLPYNEARWAWDWSSLGVPVRIFA